MKVCILGFGLEGTSAINYYLKRGANIFVYDQKPYTQFSRTLIEELVEKGVRFDFGQEELGNFDFDLCLRSPGIPFEGALITSVKDQQIPITSTTKIFFDLCPCPIVGITGSKGKGTTASLIFEMAKKSGRDVYLGGNIGTPPLDFLEKLTKDSLVILELSSFQLEDLGVSPHIAVILMTTQDHLEVHLSVEAYLKAKTGIVSHQTEEDFAIVNVNYPGSQFIGSYSKGKHFGISTKMAQKDGCFIEDNQVVVSFKGKVSKITDTKDIFLPGEHNLENVCAASMVTKILGVSNQIIAQVLKEFKGLPHRLEFIREVMGVRYFDDSFATNPDPTMAAIRAFKSPKILILGGSPKTSDFSELGKLISTEPTIKAIIGIGVEWPRIKSKIENLNLKVVEGCKNMEEVVKASREIGSRGDVVLLSPACASFDMFKNYKERGDQFKKYVNEI